MTRLVKVGAGGEEVGWHEALRDLRADDVLLLEPGFYELRPNVSLCDVTIKGTGSLPEDTTILGSVNVSVDSRFVTLENLCVKTQKEQNSLFVPPEANTYLSLRNCVVNGYGDDVAAIAANGQITLELYSTKVLSGSVSIYENASFRLEMNDSVLANSAKEYSALALEGQGTAIINNSKIQGSLDTFTSSNAEVDLNNSEVDDLFLYGKTWLNMLNSQIVSTADTSFCISDECWINVLHSKSNGGIYVDKAAHVILQNSSCTCLLAIGQAQITINNSLISTYSDFEDEVVCSATRATFNGNRDYRYFLLLNGQTKFVGHDLIFNPHDAQISLRDNASFKVSVLASSNEQLKINCDKKAKIHVLGIKWTAIKG